MTVPVDPDELGRYFQSKGELDRAGALFVRVLKANPKNAVSWNNLGTLRHQQRKLHSASVCYNNALALDRTFHAPYSNLGALAEHAGCLQEAVALHERALELSPAHGEGFYNLACAHRELLQFDQAFAAYEKAMELSPDNVICNIGYVYARDVDPRTTAEDSLKVKRQFWERHHLPAQTR